MRSDSHATGLVGLDARLFRCATLFDDAAVEQVDRAIGVRGVARIVRDHADRRAAAVQLAKQLHHRFAVRRIEVTRRLVGEEDERIAGDGAGDGDALLLTAGELRRIVLHAVAHAHALERIGDALLALGRRHAAVRERQLDVLVDREIADQVERLEDEADLAVADAGALRRRELRDRLAGERVLAVGRRVEQAEDREQRRLAAARRSFHRDVLARLDLDVDVLKGVGLHLVGVEDLLDPGEADQRLIAFPALAEKAAGDDEDADSVAMCGLGAEGGEESVL